MLRIDLINYVLIICENCRAIRSLSCKIRTGPVKYRHKVVAYHVKDVYKRQAKASVNDVLQALSNRFVSSRQMVISLSPIILYEAPHHLKSTLKDLYEAMGDRDRCV